MKLSELMLASSGGLKIEKRPMWSGIKRRDPFIRLANEAPFKSKDRIIGVGDLSSYTYSTVWGHNGSEYLAILPGQLPRTVSSDFNTTTVRSAIGGSSSSTDRFRIIGYINGNWIVQKYIQSTSSTSLYRSPDNGVTWTHLISVVADPFIFGNKLYIMINGAPTVNVIDTNTWGALANETLPGAYIGGSLRKSHNGNVFIFKSSGNQWYKKIGNGSWTVCPYVADQVNLSEIKVVALGQSDFILFDVSTHNPKRISRWNPTTDTLEFLPNFSLEYTYTSTDTIISLSDSWAPSGWWASAVQAESFLDVDGITHIPIRYQKTTEYYYAESSGSVPRKVYVYVILSTYNGESFTMTEVGDIDDFISTTILNFSFRFHPAIGGGFFYTDWDNRVNTINSNAKEIVHVL